MFNLTPRKIFRSILYQAWGYHAEIRALFYRCNIKWLAAVCTCHRTTSQRYWHWCKYSLVHRSRHITGWICGSVKQYRILLVRSSFCYVRVWTNRHELSENCRSIMVTMGTIETIIGVLNGIFTNPARRHYRSTTRLKSAILCVP